MSVQTIGARDLKTFEGGIDLAEGYLLEWRGVGGSLHGWGALIVFGVVDLSCII